MADTCPNCGYCPTCKRAMPIITQQGFRCQACGGWVAYGAAHNCAGRPPTYTHTVIATPVRIATFDTTNGPAA